MALPDVVFSSLKFENNPSKWTDPFNIKLCFDVYSNGNYPLKFKFIYVGSATDNSFNQELESCESEVVTKGRYKLNLQIDAPDPTKIPFKNIHNGTFSIRMLLQQRNVFKEPLESFQHL